MKNVIYLVIILSLSVSLCAAPQVQLSETSFNFGKAPQRTAVSHTFWIKSTGSDTLRIEKVVPGCGCTKTPLLDSVLAPGDSTSLEIIFSTKSFRGYVAKKPYIVTNISEEKIYLRIDAELFPKPESIEPVSFEPFKLDVSQFSEKPRSKAKFLLVNKSDKDYDIKIIDMNSKQFDLKLPKKIKAGETIEGMITVHKDKLNSDFDTSFTIEINDDFRTRVTLPIRRVLRNIKK